VDPISFLPMLCILTAIIGATTLMVVAFTRQQREVRMAGESLAALPDVMQGFLYTPHPEPGQLNGTYNGRQVTIYTHYIGSRKHRKLYTRVATHFDVDLGCGLRIIKDFPLSDLQKALGQRDLKTGEPAFDAAFYVMGDDDGRIIRFLDAELRGAMFAAERTMAGVQLLNHSVTHDLRGYVTDEPNLRRVLEAQSPLAELASRRIASMAVEEGEHVAIVEPFEVR